MCTSEGDKERSPLSFNVLFASSMGTPPTAHRPLVPLLASVCLRVSAETTSGGGSGARTRAGTLTSFFGGGGRGKGALLQGQMDVARDFYEKARDHLGYRLPPPAAATTAPCWPI